MREYAKVGPQFWNGKTGKALKKNGSEAVIVAMYLMTCQHANMLGLYYLNPAYIAVDTGLGLEGAWKGLHGACQAGFCSFDADTEVVWVLEMALYQIGDQLEAKDNRCKGVQREYDSLPENPFLTAFYERYGTAFHMVKCRSLGAERPSYSEAPCETLLSQEREQEQEQEQEQEKGAGKPAPRTWSSKSILAEGVDPTHLKDWAKARGKAAVTETAWAGLKAEAEKAGITPAEAVRICAIKGWRGFDSTWNWRGATNSHSGAATDDRDAEILRMMNRGAAEVVDA